MSSEPAIEDCLDALRSLANRFPVSDKDIDDAFRAHICMLPTVASRITVVEHLFGQVNYEVVRNPEQRTFWESVLSKVIEKQSSLGVRT